MKQRQVSRIPKPGDISGDVAIFQDALNEAGASPPLTVDGEFGAKTKSACAAFQKGVGLTGTGVPGAKTIEKLGITIKSEAPRVGGTISSGQDPDEGTPPWYRRMFAGCAADPGLERQVAAAVATVEKGYPRYLPVAKALGFSPDYVDIFAYVLGTLHFKEASGSFAGVLHNGEKIIGTGKKTTLVPAGRGPFSSWEEAAIDAINLNGKRWAKLRAGSTDIGEILYAMERFNGTGYISGAGKNETTPYLWACSNVNDDAGKYVRDGVFDPSATTQKAVGAALILKELWKAGKFRCTNVTAAPPMALPDLTPAPVGAISRDTIAEKIVSIIKHDVDAELRETQGHNRSPRIDEFNRRAKAYLGAPYCASGAWCAIDDACKALGLKNPVPPTASSQAFRKASFVPPKYIRPEGSLGKKGDVGVLQSPGDSARGHHTTLSEDQTSGQSTFKTVEYNTDAISGDRDGDGAYAMTRTTVDRHAMNAGKIFVCFTDIPQWIFDHNRS